MHSLQIFSVVCFLCTFIHSYKAFNLNGTLENVPEEDRLDFLKFHVNLGYKLANAHKPNSQKAKDYKMGLPNSFSQQLYEYVLKHHEVKDEELKATLFEIVCFDDGTCIDIGDVGVHPKDPVIKKYK